MKTKNFLAIFLVIFTLSGIQAKAQTNPAPVQTKPTAAAPVKRSYSLKNDTILNKDNSLNGQYQFMLSRSMGTADGYRMINPNRLTTLWKNVTDSIRKEKEENKRLKLKITDSEKTISYLKTEISGKDASLNENVDKINEIKFLGLSFNKNSYNVFVWSIIGILILALVIIITRSGKNITEAKHRTQLYNEITEEYQNFKSKANEKERKLARELQDERNKLDELLNRK
ncbi:hypothetical protein [Pedobacter sp.]|uniref:hypothetical protein n=1 Tax=Pedobacter sp. TaxID=1411316 RepID=UPI00396CD4CC